MKKVDIFTTKEDLEDLMNQEDVEIIDINITAMEQDAFAQQYFVAVVYYEIHQSSGGKPELPDDIKEFIRDITLELQEHRSKSEADIDELFQYAYNFYVKYKVDPIHDEQERPQ